MKGMRVGKKEIEDFYNAEQVVSHYARATGNIGLWASEEAVLSNVFGREDRLLELGCGTGRIAIGLTELGFRHILGTDLSRSMVNEARRLAKVLELGIPFHAADARELPFEDGLYDGAIFGFNGLMQIPGREERRKALREIRRVLKDRGKFVFTTHDRNLSKYKKLWRQEAKIWDRGEQGGQLHEFGDRFEETDLGEVFIHVPVPEEIREDLKETGFRCVWDRMRSQIATESATVRLFSDECRFWVAERIGE